MYFLNEFISSFQKKIFIFVLRKYVIEQSWLNNREEMK